MTGIDPGLLAAELIRRPSVTPKDEGALDVVARTLEGLGFTCHCLTFEEDGYDPIVNLYARKGTGSPNLCFAGHTDVVPVGAADQWSFEPFGAVLKDGVLCGRGAVDMKGAIAAFTAAAEAFLDRRGPGFTGSISFLITGDEEGVAINGTRKVLDWLKARGETIDACVVGEPTSATQLGDMIKIGRRGSMNAQIVVEGVQGHVAYPDRAANPAPVLVRYLAAAQARALDRGFEGFQPSNLEITSIDIANPATNVIPARASARLNIRFNPIHTGASLSAWLEAEARAAGDGFKGRVTVTPRISGEAFLTEPGEFTAVVAAAVTAVTGVTPELSTSGGTSDARFIRALAPVVEFGLVGTTMHKVDEQVAVTDVRTLTDIYEQLIGDYFAAFSG